VKDIRFSLLHVRDAIDAVAAYTAARHDAFLADRKTQDAVIRNLEIIGEAVKRLSSRVTNAYPDVPGRQIAGMRDKLVHDYFGVDLDLVWGVVERELPAVRKRIEAALAQGA
jgi:uncharacterized protein with HEPN domain